MSSAISCPLWSSVYECQRVRSHLGAHCCEVMYFGCFGFRGELGFLNCDDVVVVVCHDQVRLQVSQGFRCRDS